jgi:hypothetical protein
MNARRPLAGLLTAGMLLALTGCGADAPAGAERAEAADPSSSSAPTTSETPASASATPPPGRFQADVDGGRLRVTMEETDRYRVDGAMQRLHFLAVSVASDPTAERWGDIFVWAPTVAYHPKTQEPGPMPADPVAWLRSNPRAEVVSERVVRIDGSRAWVLGLEIDGLLFGDAEGGVEGGGPERYVLRRVGGTWVVVNGATFRGRRALTAPDRPGDVLMDVARSVRFAKS